MKAGREIEIQIFEKVFGQCAHDIEVKEWHWSGPHKNQIKDGTCKKCKRHFGDFGSPRGWDFPEYSREVDAAFTVLEKMSELGFNFVIAGIFDGQFGCGFTKDGRLGYSSPYYKTFPEAICVEALKALK